MTISLQKAIFRTITFSQDCNPVFLHKQRSENAFYAPFKRQLIHEIDLFSCRLVVTTVSLEENDEGQLTKMILDQIAEKDCSYCNDSQIIWEVNGDFLTMSMEVYTPKGTIKSLRKFMKHKPGQNKNGTRKMSAPF